MRRILATLVVLVAACGEDAPQAPPRFSVHEWGLVAVARGSLDGVAMSGALETTSGGATARELAPFQQYWTTSPSRPPDPMQAYIDGLSLKPVIYVHVDDARELDVSIRVHAPGGEMLEVVPLREGAAHSREAAVWPHLHARRTSCATPRTQPTCHAPDGYCEAVEDPFYDAATASCLRLGAMPARNHLLYRARVDASRLPLAVSWPYGGAVHVRNTSDVRVAGPAWLLDDGGAMRFDPPVPGAEVEIPRSTVRVPNETARAAVLELLRAQGLDDAEVHAFDVAWAHVLFDAPQDDAIARLPVGHTPAALVPSLAILYLVPDTIAGRVLPFDVTPAPTSVHRALFVRLAFAGEGPSPLDAPPDTWGEPLGGSLHLRSGS